MTDTINNSTHSYDFRNPENPDLHHFTHNNTCMHCKETNNILVTAQDFHRWKNFELIQNVFHWLTPEQRELIVSGLHSKCWNEMFSED